MAWIAFDNSNGGVDTKHIIDVSVHECHDSQFIEVKYMFPNTSDSNEVFTTCRHSFPSLPALYKAVEAINQAMQDH